MYRSPLLYLAALVAGSIVVSSILLSVAGWRIARALERRSKPE